MFPQILIQSLLNHCESLIIGRKKLLFTLRLKIFEGHGYLALIGRLMWYFAKLVGETCLLVILVKFIYSEKATKFCEIFTLLLSYVVPVKSKVKILKILVAFSEYMNFKKKRDYFHV